jgi:hypothetical protein
MRNLALADLTAEDRASMLSENETLFVASPMTTGANIMKIVVIGGSGRVGSNVVHRLVAHGHDAVPASPATGVDTITGEGLADVMLGADAVVDVSNAPVWDDDAVREFFTTSTRNLLAAERDAGVQHHLAVTIVGADRLPDSGYLRAKVAQEAEIEAGAPPTTWPPRWLSWRPPRRSATAWSSVGPRRWASTRGRGGCSPRPATRARSSATRKRGTSGPSCTAAS